MDIFAEEFRNNMLRVMNDKIAAKEDTLLEAEKTVAKLRDECENLKKQSLAWRMKSALVLYVHLASMSVIQRLRLGPYHFAPAA